MVGASWTVAASEDSSLPAWVEWVSSLAPFFTLLAALIAGSIAVASLRQRTRADAKTEWWTRFAWASDLVLDSRPESQEIGVRTLTLLARSDLAHAEELELVDAAWGEMLDAARRASGAPAGDADAGAGHGPTPQVGQHAAPQRTLQAPTRAQVLAARGRRVTDERLGRPTEPWVVAIAETPLQPELPPPSETPQ
ncbi:hypothetical protein [Sanguibacter sp. 25GB23B1]|uniref:hypothetical protein n=1 Tax=unclassified Sanguibacter TaxID=2645534 RepID=UPI0032AEA9C1